MIEVQTSVFEASFVQDDVRLFISFQQVDSARDHDVYLLGLRRHDDPSVQIKFEVSKDAPLITVSRVDGAGDPVQIEPEDGTDPAAVDWWTWLERHGWREQFADIVDGLPLGDPLLCLLKGSVTAVIGRIFRCWLDTRPDRAPPENRFGGLLACLRAHAWDILAAAFSRTARCILG